MLRYAHEHGCPLTEGALEYCLATALAGGHVDVVEYLRTAQPTEEGEEDSDEDSDEEVL